MGLYLQERPRARLTYQPGARQQEGLKERKGGGVLLASAWARRSSYFACIGGHIEIVPFLAAGE